MKNFNLKQIIRSLIRRKFYTTINIIGLGVGLGCAILMATYIIHEFSYDKYLSNADKIYRVIDGKEGTTYYAMGEAFKKDVPEIESICRLMALENISIKQNQNFIDEDRIVFADSTIIDFLDLEIIHGTKQNQLNNPNSIIISKKLADIYFPGDNPVGQDIELATANRIDNFEITGVYKDLPSYSSLQTNIIGNIDQAFASLWDIVYTIGFKKEKEVKDYRNLWERSDFTTLLILHPNTNIKSVEDKCSLICLNHRDGNEDGGIHLQPFTDIYLHSNDLESSGYFLSNQFSSLKIFMGIGLLILLVAIINFIMISNADNNLSITEIACRKVNGASKYQIIVNSLSKSVLVAFVSLIPAILFVWIMIPLFNDLFGKTLHLSLFLQLKYILILIMVTLFTGIVAGLYLGLFVSNVNPASLLQKRLVSHGQLKMFRGSLVVVQFVVFILLSSSFLLMLKQYNYSLNKDLGINTKNILAINMNDDVMRDNMNYLKNQLLNNPNVLACSPTSFTSPPSDNYLNISFNNSETGESIQEEALIFGKGVLEMMDIKLIDGQPFADSDEGFGARFIINEAAAKKYNVKAGDHIAGFYVVGIVKNFHFHSLHRPVTPALIALQTENYSYLLVKTNGKNKEVGEYIKQLSHEIAPNFYVEYELLDDRIVNFYKNEEKQMGTIGFFAGIALALSLLGLLGYVTLSLVKKTKEIGVRKINGANIMELIGMMNLQYVKWIVTAFIIACPITYYAMGKWLEDFAYKTTISWWVFGLSGLAALIFAMATVTMQSWRAAGRNPIEALRYE